MSSPLRAQLFKEEVIEPILVKLNVRSDISQDNLIIQGTPNLLKSKSNQILRVGVKREDFGPITLSTRHLARGISLVAWSKVTK